MSPRLKARLVVIGLGGMYTTVGVCALVFGVSYTGLGLQILRAGIRGVPNGN